VLNNFNCQKLIPKDHIYHEPILKLSLEFVLISESIDNIFWLDYKERKI